MRTPLDESTRAFLAANPDTVPAESRAVLGAAQVLNAERLRLAVTNLHSETLALANAYLDPQAKTAPIYVSVITATALQDEVRELMAEFSDRAPFIDQKSFLSARTVLQDIETIFDRIEKITTALARHKGVDSNASMAPIKWPKGLVNTPFAKRFDAALVAHNADVFGISIT